MRSLGVEYKASEAYLLDIGHSSHVNNPARLRTSALRDCFDITRATTNSAWTEGKFKS